MPTRIPYVCNQCSVALFYVLHVVKSCVIGMIIAGWLVTYAEEFVLTFVEHPMLSGTRVSLFVISLALLGTIATLANSWVLPSSCLNYRQSFCSICLLAASTVLTTSKHRPLHGSTAVLLLLQALRATTSTNVGGRQPLPPSAWGHITIPAIGYEPSSINYHTIGSSCQHQPAFLGARFLRRPVLQLD